MSQTFSSWPGSQIDLGNWSSRPWELTMRGSGKKLIQNILKKIRIYFSNHAGSSRRRKTCGLFHWQDSFTSLGFAQKKNHSRLRRDFRSTSPNSPSNIFIFGIVFQSTDKAQDLPYILHLQKKQFRTLLAFKRPLQTTNASPIAPTCKDTILE